MESKTASASACGKIILFGEHAVVYGRPAIAVPVMQLRVEAKISAIPNASVVIDAADVARHYVLRDSAPDDPIATIIRLTGEKLGVEPKNFSIRIHSTIPVARGLGSGAAVSVGIVRAMAKYFSRELSREETSALAYQVEKLHHGTPSGIDNTVIALEQPVYFVQGQPVVQSRRADGANPTPNLQSGETARIQTIRVTRSFLIAIADTGIASPTKIPVGDVRRGWEAQRERFQEIFEEIGEIAREAKRLIEVGEIPSLGSLMLKNQELLKQIGVSSPEIEGIVDAAVGAGAEGAKLSGAGRGGNVIALVDEDSREYVERAMRRAGAWRVIVTEVG